MNRDVVEILHVTCPVCKGVNCHMTSGYVPPPTMLSGWRDPGPDRRTDLPASTRVDSARLYFACEEGHAFAWEFDDHSGGSHALVTVREEARTT